MADTPNYGGYKFVKPCSVCGEIIRAHFEDSFNILYDFHRMSHTKDKAIVPVKNRNVLPLTFSDMHFLKQCGISTV
jgi:hypothetical protein